MEKLTVRPAAPFDAPAVTSLMNTIGYQVPLELVRAKIVAFSNHGGDLALVVEMEGEILGCITGHLIRLFHQSGACGRITCLVTSEARRGSGVGKSLLKEIEKFFIENGCIKFEVTSGDHRPGTHAFYTSQGYAEDERRFLKRSN